MGGFSFLRVCVAVEDLRSGAFGGVSSPRRPWPPALAGLLRRSAVAPAFDLRGEIESALKLMQKYADVSMSLADACLVRMSETVADPIILTTDADFRIYRRHSRQIVPCVMPD
jgi:hypothetical protein